MKLFLVFCCISIFFKIGVESAVNSTRQLQILSLFNNFYCHRTGETDVALFRNSLEFNPLEHLSSYVNPQDVQNLTIDLHNGKLLQRYLPVAHNFAETIDEIQRIYAVVFPIPTNTNEGWDLFYKTLGYYVTRMNVNVVSWTLGVLLSTKLYGQYQSPPYFEILPMLFSPREAIEAINNGGAGEQYYPENPKSVNPEDRIRYFRNEAGSNSMHVNWHLNFPFFLNQTAYGIKFRKGELFIYIAERLGNNLELMKPLQVNKSLPIAESFTPSILYTNFKIPRSREPYSSIVDTDTASVTQMQIWQDRLIDGITRGFFINEQGYPVFLRGRGVSDAYATDILGATIESSTASINPNFYGTLHNSAHPCVGEIPDPYGDSDDPGVVQMQETSLLDPAFFRIHRYIDDFHIKLKYSQKPYTLEELSNPGINIISVGIYTPNEKTSREEFIEELIGRPVHGKIAPPPPVTLQTFFENFTYDVSNAVLNCERVRSGEPLTVTIKRLNYKNYEYVVNIWSKKPSRETAVMRIFISPLNDPDGKPFGKDELFWNMIELDRFPFVIKPGRNVVIRSSLNSTTTYYSGGDLPGFKELIRKYSTDNNVPERITSACGWPVNMLIPRGTRKGMKFQMVFIISPVSRGYREEDYPSIVMCGMPNPGEQYPDERPFGFPFDKKVEPSKTELATLRNLRFLDIVIKHKVQPN